MEKRWGAINSIPQPIQWQWHHVHTMNTRGKQFTAMRYKCIETQTMAARSSGSVLKPSQAEAIDGLRAIILNVLSRVAEKSIADFSLQFSHLNKARNLLQGRTSIETQEVKDCRQWMCASLNFELGGKIFPLEGNSSVPSSTHPICVVLTPCQRVKVVRSKALHRLCHTSPV